MHSNGFCHRYLEPGHPNFKYFFDLEYCRLALQAGSTSSIFWGSRRRWEMSSAGGCIEILHDSQHAHGPVDLAVACAVPPGRVELDNNHINRFSNLGGHAPATP